MLGPIGQISMRATDIDRATAFYRDTLGVPLLFRAGTLSFFNCGGVRLMLSLPEKDFDHPRLGALLQGRRHRRDPRDARLARRVDRARAAPDREMPDHELWMSFLPRFRRQYARADAGEAVALRSQRVPGFTGSEVRGSEVRGSEVWFRVSERCPEPQNP